MKQDRHHFCGLDAPLPFHRGFHRLHMGPDRPGHPAQSVVFGFAQGVIRSLVKQLIQDKGQQRQIAGFRFALANKPRGEVFGNGETGCLGRIHDHVPDHIGLCGP